jgi:hypothetical protein
MGNVARTRKIKNCVELDGRGDGGDLSVDGRIILN